MKRLVLLLIIVAVGLGVYSFIKYEERPILYLNVASINVEYGEKLDVNFSDFIDTTVLNDEDAKDVIDNTKITFDSIIEEDDILEIGKYPVLYEYSKGDKKESKTVMIVVADTLAPEFNDVSVLQTQVGKSIDYKSYIEVTDYSGVDSIEFYAQDVEIDRSGEYELLAIAKDNNGNISEKTITIIVK